MRESSVNSRTYCATLCYVRVTLRNVCSVNRPIKGMVFFVMLCLAVIAIEELRQLSMSATSVLSPMDKNYSFALSCRGFSHHACFLQLLLVRAHIHGNYEHELTRTVYVLKNQQFVKFVRRNLIRKYAALLWFASGFCAGSSGYGIAAIFAERATIFAKHDAIRRTQCIFTAKRAAILELRRFTRRRTAARPSKCSAHGGRKAAHMVPRFQVPPWCVCCILLTYTIRTYVQLFTRTAQ